MHTAHSETDDVSALRARLEEAERLIGAIRAGEVDALVVATPQGDAVYTLAGVDRPYRAFLNAMREGAFTVDASGTVLYANKAFAALVGRPLEAVLGSDVHRLFDGPLPLQAASPEPWEGDLLAADGRRIPVAVSSERIALEDNGMVAAVVRDLSEHRLTQRLHEIDERMRLAAESAGFGVYDFDPRTQRAVWSVQLKRIFGLADDAVEDPAFVVNHVHPDDRDGFLAETRRATDADQSRPYEMEFRIVREDGEIRWLHDTARLDVDTIDGRPTLVRIVGTLLDVTERKRAEEALTARARQLDLLARTAQRLLLAAEPGPELLESIFLDIARLIGMETFYHYRPATEPGVLRLQTSAGATIEEQRLFAAMRFGELLCGRVAETRERLIVEDLQHSTHPGSDVLRLTGATSYAGFPLLADGELVGTIAFVSRRRTHFNDGDVQMIQTICDQIATTLERARRQRDARLSEERARLALEAADLGSWDVDIQSGEVAWSQRHATLQGYPPETPASVERWQERVHPEDLPQVTADMERARLTRAPFVVEHRYSRADTGEERWMALYGRWCYNELGEAVRLSGVSRDVTARLADEAARLIAEEALRVSETRFRRASEAVGALVYDTDLTGSTPAAVHGLEAVIGGSPSDTASSDFWHERMHPDDVPGHLVRLRDALESGARRWADHYRVRHADGSWRHVEDVAEIVRAADDTPTRLVGTILDVTERVEHELALAESEQRFRAMADQTPIVMWVTDTQGGVEFVNQAYCVFFGVSLDQLRGRHWAPLVHPDDQGYVTAFADAVAGRRPFRASARVRRADGEWRWIASVGHPRYANGEFIGMIGVSPDMTEQRRASELEREAARQKDEFIAVLAHELRNPLAPIRTSVSVLRTTGSAEPLVVKCRDIIDRQVAHMARLLDDLLDVSRLSQGKLTLQRATVRLREVVDAAVETARPLINDRGHLLTVDEINPALVLDADAARLAQVLTNLLNNAGKYTQSGGRIALAVEEGSERVTIRVSDNGIGIRPEMHQRIFDLFTQIEDARTRVDGGLGIGLGLAKRLVELHGGTITAESPGAGQGSTFTVTLPLHAQTHTSAQPAERERIATPAASLRRRVLVVDDNTDAADTLAMLLEAVGCDVRAAYDGETALREAAHFQPDLVLLDLGMPGLDGQTVCHRLRADAWGANIVIAAVTGWGQDEDRRRTRAAGFDHHLVKPVAPEVLIELVAELPHQPIT